MANNVVQNEGGFSLVEVLVAVTIFAIGLLATAGMQLTALQSNAGAYKMTTINSVAAGILEEILTWEPDDPRLIDEAGNPHAWDFDPGVAVDTTLTAIGAGIFTAEYDVQRNVPIGSVSTITLTVSSPGSLSSWGGNQRILTCVKKTQ